MVDTRIDTADVLAVDDAIARSTGAAGFGITREGFIPKSFPRLLAEKLSLARMLLGDDLDLTSGSVIRKIFEVTALEEMRTWAALATWYDNSFVVSASGAALDALGVELGLPRPYLEATGTITLQAELPAGVSELVIPRGARLLTDGGHHVATDEQATFSAANPAREVAVVAFYPGPEHNLDPGQAGQTISIWNPEDDVTGDRAAVAITHDRPLTGGQLRWSDARYRELLLRAPRSIWTVEAIQTAVSLVPGVKQAQVRDAWGGLDLNQSIFGNFNFIERLFSSERDLGSPYYFTVLVAPTPGAIWEGPAGLRVAIESAIEDLRPIGIFPNIVQAEEVAVSVAAEFVVRGLPLPTGSRASVNASPPAVALKRRLLGRVRRYIDGVPLGDPVRAAEVSWALMNEPGVVDVRGLTLIRHPPAIAALDLTQPLAGPEEQLFTNGANIDLGVNQIPVFVDDDSRLAVI